MESDNYYEKVYITIRLTKNANRLLTESCARSKRKKIQEASLRLEDHLRRFRSISELDFTVDYQNSAQVNYDCSSHIKKTTKFCDS